MKIKDMVGGIRVLTSKYMPKDTVVVDEGYIDWWSEGEED